MRMSKIFNLCLWLGLIVALVLGVLFFLHPQWVIDNQINDRSVVLGLAVSLIGFGITIWQVRQAKTVAKAARDAAEEAKNKFIKTIAITDLSKAVQEITQVKKHFKKNSWEEMANSCEYLVSVIASVKTGNSCLEQKDLDLLKKAEGIFSDLEMELIEAVSKKREPDVVRLMQKAKNPAVELQVLLEKIKRI